MNYLAKQVNDLFNNKTLTREQKINGINALYKTAHDCGLTQDSAYVLILIKMGTSEFALKRSYASAIQYTLEALRINHSLKDKGSPALNNLAYSNLAYYYQGVHFYDRALAYYDSLILSSQVAGTFASVEGGIKLLSIISLGDQQKCIEESTIGMAEAAAHERYLCIFLF